MRQGVSAVGSEVRAIAGDRENPDDFKTLNRRDESDPMRLYSPVLEELDNYFSTRGLTYLSGQRELLAQAVESVLQAVPGATVAIPFQPGLGKSTLICALLKVLSFEFQRNTLIGQTVGGVIVVVEKTEEAEELEQLCNGPGGQHPVAKAISAPNDYNLSQGRCLNGTAACYEECPRRGCPDYDICELMQSVRQIHSTPILINDY